MTDVLMLAAERWAAAAGWTVHHIARRRPTSGADVDEGASNVLSTISHLGYGAGAGAAYQLLVPARAQGAGSGVAFALALYAGSYLGLLPALGLKPAGQRRSNVETGVMVLAHVVFGAVLGESAARAKRSLAGRE
ncbi:MAG: hypothetical protein ACR2L4_05320 [Actinomycetota bacterium]